MFARNRASRRPKTSNKILFRGHLEQLEDRVTPAQFNPLPSLADGASLSLRDAIVQSDGNSDASNTIILSAGTYSLTDTAAGNLLIQDTASGVPTLKR